MSKISNMSKLDEIENKIIVNLNDADNNLTKNEFEKLSESIISYIDEIGRRKNKHK